MSDVQKSNSPSNLNGSRFEFKLVAILICGLLAAFFVVNFSLSYWVSPERSSHPQNANDLVMEWNFEFPANKDKFNFSGNSDEIVEKNSHSIVLPNNVTMLQSGLIYIDKNKIYRLSGSFYLPPNISRKESGLHVGFATYEHNKKTGGLLTGPNRFFLIKGIIPKKVVKNRDRIIRIEGYITGAAALHKKFHKTHAKLIVKITSKIPNIKIGIMSLKLKEFEWGE